jgi:GNAT superfamily N-acetyltransferase
MRCASYTPGAGQKGLHPSENKRVKMDITVSKNSDPIYEHMFDQLMMEVFGFSFAPWFALGLWDKRYESYSIIQDGKMLSNVCIFKTDLLLRGEIIRAHQFGAVATIESARGRGLSRLLMEHVLSLYPETPAFLFANPGVIDFYPRFGFRQVHTHRPVISQAINNTAGHAVRYSPDSEFIQKALYSERCYSDVLDCVNTQPVQLFHLLLSYPESIYYLPRSGAIIVAQQEGSRLFIADVVTQKPTAFSEIKDELPFSGIDTVEFGFYPDRLGITPDWQAADGNESPFFLRGAWDLPEQFLFPALSAT